MKGSKPSHKRMIYTVIASLLCVTIGISVLLMRSFETYPHLKEANRVYNGTNTHVNDNKNIIVSVAMVNILDDTHQQVDYYLALTEDKYFVIVELPKGDQTFNTLKKDNFNVLDKPYQLVARQKTLDASMQNSLKARFSNTSLKKRMNIHSLVSVPAFHDSQLSLLIIGISTLTLGVLGCVACVIGWIKSRQSYRLLCGIYPELQKDFSSIKTNSAYYDATLEISVYKQHLIFMKRGVQCFNLSQIEELEYQITSVFGGGTKVQVYSFLLLVNTSTIEVSDKKLEKVSIYQQKYKDAFHANLQEFLGFIAGHYTHIKLGNLEDYNLDCDTQVVPNDSECVNVEDNPSMQGNREDTQ
ncbi:MULTISPECIES: hypothetical protein [unclassified Granulicatella]|uniref:hypothetical protein n=1 Tax=unclassified Granulicatella TaxID=2630493 RepID=UPI0010736497|nr:MULTISPECIES: hypothetical protein [unclassified Granulicatella]MBF0779778.1 hypothetical protein [Granulicatella sp. 19428wC4_WM01]TFU96180.1 hypothetical protein E4T68_01600 [Granulicatella sp. WM01]